MIILPAIDINDGKCVRLVQGDYSTAEVVAEDAVQTARNFASQGARWLHMVDLDGAKAGKPQNAGMILTTAKSVDMHVEVGGGIRDMDTVTLYLNSGVDRVIIGSAALSDPDFVREAVKKFGKRIAVGIDAMNGKVAAEGWLQQSEVDYLALAREMDAIGVSYIIFTDISKDGTLNGPNLDMLDKLNNTVSCNIIASGGVSNLIDIISIFNLGLYGAITGKAIYSGTLDLSAAVAAAMKISGKKPKNSIEIDDNLERYFRKSELIPAVVQESSTGEVLMLAYMNRESLEKTMETRRTWFYSRSRKQLWNKGESSGHFQDVQEIYSDCDDDTLLIKVKQTGAACHTGRHSCFYRKLV